MTKQDTENEDKLKKFSPVIRSAMEGALAKLPARIATEILPELSPESTQEGKKEKSYFNRFLRELFFQSGFLFASIRYNGRSVFRYGPEELNHSERDRNPKKFLDYTEYSLARILEHFHATGGSMLEIEGVVPAEIQRLSRKLLRLEILPIVSLHYLNYPVLQDKRVQDLLEPVEKEIRKLAARSAETGEGVVLTHFRFQGMDHYFEFMGDHYSKDVTETVRTSLAQHLKPGDPLFALSSRSYLGVSPGADPNAILRRFRSIYIQVSGLILDYELIQSRITDEVDLSKIWKELEL